MSHMSLEYDEHTNSHEDTQHCKKRAGAGEEEEEEVEETQEPGKDITHLVTERA